jgi:aryl-alcohol dehydrogenase-like predicted oxidoreductase
MQYSMLGSSGLVVSKLAFGAMLFSAGSSQIMKSIYKVDSTVADQLISRSLEAGVNFFDTADAYANGDSETILGAALKGRRDDVIIATKVGIRSGPGLNQSGLSRRHIISSCEESLRRLGTDWIDVYIVHREDPFTPLKETLSALDSLVRSGKVRYLGFSNWSAWRAAAAMEMQKSAGLAPFTHGQMYYSLLGRDAELEVIPMMQHYGLGLTAWSPLSSGFLTGKYTRDNIYSGNNRFSEMDFLPFDKEAGFRLVELMKDIAASHKASVSQVALAWLLSKKIVNSVLVSASNISQLDDNLGAISINLSDAEISSMEQMIALPTVYPNWFIQKLNDTVIADALKRN